MRWAALALALTAAACGGRSDLGPTGSTAGISTAGMSADEIYDLARAYEDGDGVPQDITRAVALLTEASRRGEIRASERLGILAARGEIDADDARIRDRLTAAYLHGRPGGGIELARHLLASQSRTPADVDRAVSILRDVAADGSDIAKAELAEVYASREYGRQDHRAAEQLLLEVQRNGQRPVALQLARLYGDAEGPLYNPAEARQWAVTAVNRGEPRAWVLLGDLQADPILATYDPVAAEAAYREAIEAGETRAREGLVRFLVAHSRGSEARELLREIVASGGDPSLIYSVARAVDVGGAGTRAQAYPLYIEAAVAGHQGALSRLLQLVEDDVGTPDQQVQAMSQLASAAERSSDPELQGRVGRLHLIDRGTGPNVARGLDLIQRAVDAGNVDAAAGAAAAMRTGGESYAADPATAARLYAMAANAGDGDSLIRLARMQEQSGAVAEARASYMAALQAGYGDAAMRLFRLAQDNPGLDIDLATVLAGLETAAGNGDSDAMLALGDLAAEPISGGAPDDARAIAWYRQAADAGNATALRRLGDFARDGRGGLAPADATALYEQAVAGGDTGGSLRLARSLLAGVPTQEQVAEALALTGPLAEGGDPEAQYWHGIALGAAGRPDEALTWLVRAYEGGQTRALDEIAAVATQGGARSSADLEATLTGLLAHGSDCERARVHTLLGDLATRGAFDVGAAADHYTEAMRLGDPAAAVGLGRMHLTGVGVEGTDLGAAHGYFAIAAEAGVPEAAQNLANIERLMSDAERARADERLAELRGSMAGSCS